MHPIETKITEFLTKNPYNPNTLDSMAREFSTKLSSDLVTKFTPKEEEPFRLRMSNIGLPLRQLCLQRDYGFRGKNNQFVLNTFYGTMLESLMVFLLKASGCTINSINEKVTLRIGEFLLKGELDIIIDNVVYDIKSASNYSYNNKFTNFESLSKDDSFGYVTQGFGYAMAKQLPFGGWIVINKEKGIFKVISIPILDSIQNPLKRIALTDIETKIHHITNTLPAPKCAGVIEEWFRKKKTGNYILNRNCEWCNYKSEVCHKDNVEHKECMSSEAKEKPMRYYIGNK